MLYANFDLAIKRDQQKDYFVCLGERGANCRQVKLPVSKRFPGLLAHQLEKEFHFERNGERQWGITIDRGGNGNSIYLILSTRPNCSGGRSYISQLCSMPVTRVIVRANGVKQTEPYAGHWETLVVKACHGDVFRLTWGTYNCDRADTLYLVWNDNVYCSDLVRFDRLSERLGEMPEFPWQWRDDQLKISLRDWQVI